LYFEIATANNEHISRHLETDSDWFTDPRTSSWTCQRAEGTDAKRSGTCSWQDSFHRWGNREYYLVWQLQTHTL